MKVYNSDALWMHGRGVRDLQEVRGAGIGSIFSSLYSSLVPIVKSALRLGKRAASSSVGRQLTKELKRSVSKAGLNVVADSLAGENILESSKREMKKATKELGRKAATVVAKEMIQPPPPTSKRKAKKSRQPVAKVKKRVVIKKGHDIFH